MKIYYNKIIMINNNTIINTINVLKYTNLSRVIVLHYKHPF